jgi:hypothetical protein
MANIVPPRRREDWFEVNGQPTLRLIRFFESLTESSNDTTTIINNSTEETNGALSAKLAMLQMQVGSGVPLTIDTTGFTVDTTFQFTDQTEV